MNEQQPISKDIEQTFETLLEAWKNKDWDQARPLLNHICKNMDIEVFEQTLLQGVDAAKGIVSLFLVTALSESPEGSPANTLYKRAIGYIIRNEFLDNTESTIPPPELLPEMQRLKRGEGPYPFEKVANEFGLTSAQLVTAFEKIMVMESFNRIQTPGPGETVH